MVSPATSSTLPADHASRSAGIGRSLAGGLSRILGTQALLAATGIACLPVLARNLGPAAYGGFSLFVTVMGVVLNLDFARPVQIRELAGGVRPDGRARLGALGSLNAVFLTLVATLAGFAILGPVSGVGLALCAGFHASASRHFAALSAAGRVAGAQSVRNVAWSATAAVVVAASFATSTPHAWVWPFAAGNAAILFVLGIRVRRLGLDAPTAPTDRSSLSRIRSEAWPAHGAEVRDLVGFAAASGVVVSADRVVLDHAAPGDVAGTYIAHADLAIKMNAIGTALGHLLYPVFSRDLVRVGTEAAERRFVRLAGRIACVYFVVIAGLLLFEKEVVGLVLGEDFLVGRWVYSLTLIGIFVHLWGFLLTPWQRARGDFATQRRAYLVAGVAMLVVAFALVPTWGVRGAMCAYFTARIAELWLFCHEVRRLPASVLPRWRLVALAGMLLALIGLAVRTTGALA